MSRSNNWIEPPSGASSPVMRLNSVVLPAPFGPMISRRSPGSTFRLTLAVTRRPPNDLLKPLTASAVMAFGSASGATFFVPLIARHAARDSRAMPGTRPSGMNTTIATKMAPSMKFQRTT